MRCVWLIVDLLTVPEGSLREYFVCARIWTAAVARNDVCGHLNACQQHDNVVSYVGYGKDFIVYLYLLHFRLFGEKTLVSHPWG